MCERLCAWFPAIDWRPIREDPDQEKVLFEDERPERRSKQRLQQVKVIIGNIIFSIYKEISSAYFAEISTKILITGP